MVRRIGALRNEGLLYQSATVFAGSAVLSFGGFLFHAVASRAVGVEAYGVLYTVISLSAVAALPGAVLAPVVSRFAAELDALHGEQHLRAVFNDLVRLCVCAVALYVILGAALALPASRWLDIPIWGLPVVVAIGACAFASAVLRAYAQGLQQFRGYAVSTAVEGIVKVGALVVLLLAGARLAGGAAGFFVGAVGGVAAIVLAVRARLPAIHAQALRYDWRRLAIIGTGSAAMIIATTCMGSLDVILVKHYFGGTQAGLYATAALAGKVVLYFLGFIPIVALPRITSHYVKGERTRTTFVPALAAFGILALGCALVFGLWSRLLLHVLVGYAFDAAAPLLPPYAIAMTALSLTSVLATYGLATHRLAFVVPLLAGTAGTMLAIVLAHASLLFVVREMVAGNVATCAAVALALLISARQARTGHLRN